MIGWTFLFPSSEPYPGAKYPLSAAELRLGEPESAQCESGHLIGDSVRVVAVAVVDLDVLGLFGHLLYLLIHVLAPWTTRSKDATQKSHELHNQHLIHTIVLSPVLVCLFIRHA